MNGFSVLVFRCCRSKEFSSLFFALISGILQYCRADKPAGEVDERTRSGSKRYRSAIVHFEVKLELHYLDYRLAVASEVLDGTCRVIF